MWKDPIVEEIRKTRLKIESECDNNFDKIFEQAFKAQKKFSNRIVRKPGNNAQYSKILENRDARLQENVTKLR